MQILELPEIKNDLCIYRPRGRFSLVEAVDLVSRAISNCRKQGVNKLLIDVTGLVDLPIPTLVDRFLMVEDWAQEAKRPCHDRIGGATRVHSSAKIRR